MCDFTDFLKRILSKTSVKEEVIEQIISNPKHIKTFERAFTHKTFDPSPDNNYETLETLGDLVVNMSVVNWIHANKRIISSDWLSKIKHKLIGERQLALFAEENGFYEHIRIGEEYEKYINLQLKNFLEIPKLFESFGEVLNEEDKKPIVQIIDYRKLLEDTFESFCGALQVVINEVSGLVAGPGYAVCYDFMSSLLKDMKFSYQLKDVSPPVTLLKQKVYDPNGWVIKEHSGYLVEEFYHYIKDYDKSIKYFKITFYIPENLSGKLESKKIKGKTVYLLGTGYATDKKQAKVNAAIKSLKMV